MTNLEAMELRRRLAGPPAPKRNPFAFQPPVVEWKPRFLVKPAFPRQEAAAGPKAPLPTYGDGAQLRAKTA